jgi:hypothetical protein
LDITRKNVKNLTEKKIEEVKNQFTAWGKRNLTIMGKILIIKTLILPKFTFLASSCVVPKMYIKKKLNLVFTDLSEKGNRIKSKD